MSKPEPFDLIDADTYVDESPRDEVTSLRARVAKLEAALKLATDFLEDVQDGLRLNGWGKELAELFVALKDAPQ